MGKRFKKMILIGVMGLSLAFPSTLVSYADELVNVILLKDAYKIEDEYGKTVTIIECYEKRMIQGHMYHKEMELLGFGKQALMTEEKKKGMRIECIIEKSNHSYRILKIIK